LGTNKPALRPSRKMAATDPGLPDIGINVRKSGQPDLPMCKTPRTRLRHLANPKLPAPHHEAGRNRRVHQTGRSLLSTTRFRTRFSARSDPPQYAACRQWSCRGRTLRTFHSRTVVLIRSIRWIRSAPSRIDPVWAPAWGQCRTERGRRLNLFPACQRSMGR
jgi:hypothetical protein